MKNGLLLLFSGSGCPELCLASQARNRPKQAPKLTSPFLSRDPFWHSFVSSRMDEI